MAKHFCTEHKVAFFMKGAMRGYAHPIEGSDPTEWCNEPELEEGAAPEETTEETGTDAIGTSIEQQVAAKEVGLAFCSGKLPLTHHLVKVWAEWCEDRLGK